MFVKVIEDKEKEDQKRKLIEKLNIQKTLVCLIFDRFK